MCRVLLENLCSVYNGQSAVNCELWIEDCVRAHIRGGSISFQTGGGRVELSTPEWRRLVSISSGNASNQVCRDERKVMSVYLHSSQSSSNQQASRAARLHVLGKKREKEREVYIIEDTHKEE